MATAKPATTKSKPRAAPAASTPRPETRDWTPAPEPEPAAAPIASPAPAPAAGGPMDERTYALLLHLSALSWLISIPGFIGPLVMWLIKKDQSPFIDRHGRAAMAFHIRVFIYAAAAALLFGVIAVATLGIGAVLLIPVLVLAAIAAMVLVVVLPIVAALKANQGQEYAYPLSLRILRRPPQ